MKFSHEWIASYLPGPAPDPKALGERLTAVGFIVEGVEGSGADTVFDVEITANRPDGMSHRGLAREAALALGRAFAEPEAGPPLRESDTAADMRARVLRRGAEALHAIFRARRRGNPRRRGERRRRDAPSCDRRGDDLLAGGRHEPRPLGHRPTAPRVRPRHAREGGRRLPDDHRAAGPGGGDARDARRRHAGSHPPASRDRGRREARRSRGRHGRARDGDLGEDDARPPRGSAFRPARGAEDGAFSRHAHGRLAPLRAGNRSRGDARRARPGRPPDPRGLRRHAVPGHDRRPRTAGEPACTPNAHAPPRASRGVPRNGHPGRALCGDPRRPRVLSGPRGRRPPRDGALLARRHRGRGGPHRGGHPVRGLRPAARDAAAPVCARAATAGGSRRGPRARSSRRLRAPRVRDVLVRLGSRECPVRIRRTGRPGPHRERSR